VGRPAVRDQLAVSLDRVVVTEPGALHIDAAGVHEQPVVEARRLHVAHVRLEHECLDSEVAQALVAACVTLQVSDAGDLEPDEVVRVVRDPLSIGLGEAHSDVG